MTGTSPAWAGSFDLPDLGDLTDLPARQRDWRQAFETHLYGPIPPSPDRVRVHREALPDDDAERLVLEIDGITVDAALWLPKVTPAPLIAGLDFLGPAGVLTSDAFPLDPDARIYSRPDYGARPGRLDEVLRCTSAYRWPIDMMLRRGFAVIVSCYGSWAPDDPRLWNARGIAGPDSGAISLWAWAIARLIDAAGQLPQIDATRVAIAGHSRLGKAALWAAACDPRIMAVFANQSGCAGAAPARHPVGETLTQLAESFPHWLRPDANTAPPVDQHQLLASIAPRAVYIANAEDDLWADPIGSHEALKAASAAWGDTQRRTLGHHIRPGGHDLLPHDWRKVLNFLETQTVFSIPPST